MQNGSCIQANLSPAEMAEWLGVRGWIYAILARGFSYPDEGMREFFQQISQDEIKPQGEIIRTLAQVLEASRSSTREELAAAYLRMFHPLNGSYPYQSEHARNHEFSKAHNLADIMGFYRAFGVEPFDDRPDHLAAELEFMHLLIMKEIHALQTCQSDKAILCRQASEKFLRQHLLAWTDSLLRELRSSNDNVGSFYTHLMVLLELFLEAEKENLT